MLWRIQPNVFDGKLLAKMVCLLSVDVLLAFFPLKITQEFDETALRQGRSTQ